jgi:hypothetical protein
MTADPEKAALVAALSAAVGVIRTWHGMAFRRALAGYSPENDPAEAAAWELYYNHAPEMKPIREALR